MNQERMTEKDAAGDFWITSYAAKIDSNGYFDALFCVYVTFLGTF
jgi:hypothetical protein